MSKDNRTKYQQFLTAEKELQEKGFVVIENTVLIRKDIWDRSVAFNNAMRVRFQENEALMKQIGRAN